VENLPKKLQKEISKAEAKNAKTNK
jgi:hypothetical protein